MHPIIKMRDDMRRKVKRSVIDFLDTSDELKVKRGLDSSLRECIINIVNKNIFITNSNSISVSLDPDLTEINKYLSKGIRIFKKVIRDEFINSLDVIPRQDEYLN